MWDDEKLVEREHVYMDVVMKKVKMGMGRRGVSFLKDGREWRLPGLLYA